ncbi:hypothetical protein ACP70R_006481 [Stipagrostis hirtigluma subsp. patula]
MARGALKIGMEEECGSEGPNCIGEEDGNMVNVYV